ncbi:hypothetical protein LSAT2_021681 [Lamellibrachia satsuma]|nr:hypothetical protein LSAT2_021681 [Lamellibrachia satsuma]
MLEGAPDSRSLAPSSHWGFKRKHCHKGKNSALRFLRNDNERTTRTLTSEPASSDPGIVLTTDRKQAST